MAVKIKRLLRFMMAILLAVVSFGTFSDFSVKADEKPLEKGVTYLINDTINFGDTDVYFEYSPGTAVPNDHRAGSFLLTFPNNSTKYHHFHLEGDSGSTPLYVKKAEGETRTPIGIRWASGTGTFPSAENPGGDPIVFEAVYEDDPDDEGDTSKYTITTSTDMGIDLSILDGKTEAEEGELISVEVSLQEGRYMTQLYYEVNDEGHYDLVKGTDGNYSFEMPAGNVHIFGKCGEERGPYPVQWKQSDGTDIPILTWAKPTYNEALGDPVGYDIQVVRDTVAQESEIIRVDANTFEFDCSDLINTVVPDSSNHCLIIGGVRAVYGKGEVFPIRKRSSKDLEYFKVRVNYDANKVKNVTGEGWYYVGQNVTISAEPIADDAEIAFYCSNGKPSEWEEGTNSFTYKLDKTHIDNGYYFISTDIVWPVTFHLNNTQSDVVQRVRDNMYAEEIDDPVYEGYVFDGWYTDPECEVVFTFADKVVKATDVYAKWVEKKDVSVTLDFGSDHKSLAETVEKEWKDKFKAVTLNGSTLTITLSNVDEDDDPRSVADVQQLLHSLLEDAVEETEDESSYIYVAQNQIGSYSSMMDIFEEMSESSGLIDDGQGYYALFGEVLQTVVVDVTPPICGTEVNSSTDPYGPREQTNRPAATSSTVHVSIAAEHGLTEESSQLTYWIESIAYGRPNLFSGPIQGGKDYTAFIGLTCDFGYAIGPKTVVTVNKKPATVIQDYGATMITGSVTAVHDWNEPTYEWADDYSTCTGTAKCKHCSETITETVRSERLVFEPTEENPGFVAYLAEFTKDPFKQTVVVKYLSPLSEKYTAIKGIGSVWTKGSSSELEFAVQANENDEQTHELFQKIAVDGKTVDPANYTHGKGSVVINLKPAYLETLSVGGHTLSVSFDDVLDKTVDIPFTVKEKSSGGSSTPKKPTTPVDNVVTCQMAGYPANYNWNEAAKACQAGYIDAGGTFHPYRTVVRKVPNTSDRDIMIHAWIAMLSVTIGLFCAVKLLHEDWEV